MFSKAGGVVSIMTLMLTQVQPVAAEGGAGGANLFSGDLVVAICTLAVFVLVLAVLTKFTWGPLLSAIQKRERFISESLASAKRDRESAESRLAEYERKLAAARDEASAIVAEGRRDAEEVRRRMEEEARASAELLIERAKREIGVARDGVLRELHEESAQLAISMASAVLRRQLSPEDQQRLLDEALAELRQGDTN